MADDEHARAAALDVLLEPLGGGQVEVVGRLVEQQHVGAPEQQSGQSDAHLPAARELLCLTLAVALGKTEPGEDAADLGFDGVAAAALELFLEFGVAMHQVVEAIDGPLDLRLDGAHLFFGGQQVGYGREDFVVQRAAGLDSGVLGQVADDRRLGQSDLATVRLLQAGHDLEQRRLARAVRRD